MIACELLQSVQTVVDENEASVALNDVLRFIDNSISAALLKRSRSKLVAVERSAFQGEEQRTDGAVATVGCNNGVLLKDFVKFGYFHFASYFYRCIYRCKGSANRRQCKISLLFFIVEVQLVGSGCIKKRGACAPLLFMIMCVFV